MRFIGGSPIYREPVEECKNWGTLPGSKVGLVSLRDELERGYRVGEPGRAEPRAGIELVAVPGAFEVAVAHHAFSERAVLVRADVGDGPERSVLADDGDALAVDVNRPRPSVGQIGKRAQENEAVRSSGGRPVAARFFERGGLMEQRDRKRYQPQQ